MKTDIELLAEICKESEYPNKTIDELEETIMYAPELSIELGTALTALATLRNEIINYHAFILMDNLAEIKKLGCSNSDDADMALDYFNNLLKKYK